MGIFDKESYYWGRNQKPKDPNSNSAIRGHEKRLIALSKREQTDKVLREIKKINEKIENQRLKIEKRKSPSKS